MVRGYGLRLKFKYIFQGCGIVWIDAKVYG
jgi:hypothetical protein